MLQDDTEYYFYHRNPPKYLLRYGGEREKGVRDEIHELLLLFTYKIQFQRKREFIRGFKSHFSAWNEDANL